MKIFEKLKKVFLGIGVFLVTLPMKVYGLTEIEIQPEYGIPEPTTRIWEVLRFLFKILLPIIVLVALSVGTIVYFKKSKSSEKKKLFITISFVLILILIILIGEILIYR